MKLGRGWTQSSLGSALVQVLITPTSLYMVTARSWDNRVDNRCPASHIIRRQFLFLCQQRKCVSRSSPFFKHNFPSHLPHLLQLGCDSFLHGSLVVAVCCFNLSLFTLTGGYNFHGVFTARTCALVPSAFRLSFYIWSFMRSTACITWCTAVTPTSVGVTGPLSYVTFYFA